jgi:methylglutaconyl-CoA hydratase
MPASPLQLDADARGVVRVTLDRPDVFNAFDEDMIEQLAATMTRLDADDSVRVVVLAATGSLFCAGADIGWMQRAAENDYATNLADARVFAGMMDKLARCRKPVIARVQGAAFGGGVGLVAAADVVIASEKAKFCVSEARFGILPAVIGPYLVNAVGVRQAKRLALTMCVLTPVEAQALGLVHRVAEEHELDVVVEQTVNELLVGGPNALAEIKAFMAQLSEGPVTDEVRELTAQTISRVRATAEAKEGFAAFVEKRSAAWRKK